MLYLLRNAGENSFFIYIWHMPIAGIVARLMSIGPLQYLTLLRPFVVLVVVMAAGQLATLLLKKLELQKCAFLIGLNGR
jgi:peptidoglycan/LPS O-acetylase OafA/YrhL